MKKALITGVYGQDGAYLAKFLLTQGYHVVGGSRRSSLDETYRLRELNVQNHVEIINFDLTDAYNVYSTVENGDFTEIYNLGAQSFVGASWDLPLQTMQVDAVGPLYLLDAIKRSSPGTKYYQASTSEMFGLVQQKVQNEKTPFYPRSPYGVSKLFAHWMTVNYRESFDLFACSGILFNHESPLRGREFVTKKITTQICEWKYELRDYIEIGNLDAKRDWGFAEEYVRGMWLMLQQETPDDFVLATGETHSVRNFCTYAANALDIDIGWEGSGINEIGYDLKTNKVIFKVSPKFFRPSEVDLLIGDAQKAKTQMGWEPKVMAKELAGLMVSFDHQKIRP
jgi:GDPmannose 4,6-dehydratase